MLDLISADLGIPYELIVPKDYEELLALFAEAKLDLAYFGGYSFVLASQQSAAVPLVQRHLDSRFTTYFIARADSPLKDLNAYKGKPFCFGSRLSTSGHLMARSYLVQKGLEPEQFFGEVRYSGAHDKTIYSVRDGEVALGAVNSQVYNEMLADGRLERGILRIVEESTPYSDYLWAAHPALSKQTQDRIRDAFLSLTLGNPAHREVLDSLGTAAFMPLQDSEYDPIRYAIEHTPGL